MKHIKVKDASTSLFRSLRIEDKPLEEPGLCNNLYMYKKTSLCVEFLKIIDTFGELSELLTKDIFDPVQKRRDWIQDQIALLLSVEDYFEFTTAKQISFLPSSKEAKVQKFKNWLYKDKPTKLDVTLFALEIISYLARQTVAEIVDMAFIVKKDRDPDVFARCFSSTAYNHDLLHKEKLPTCKNDSKVDFKPIISPLLPSMSKQGSWQTPNTVLASLHRPESENKVTKKTMHSLPSSQLLSSSDVMEAIRRFYLQNSLFPRTGPQRGRKRLLCI